MQEDFRIPSEQPTEETEDFTEEVNELFEEQTAESEPFKEQTTESTPYAEQTTEWPYVRSPQEQPTPPPPPQKKRKGVRPTTILAVCMALSLLLGLGGGLLGGYLVGRNASNGGSAEGGQPAHDTAVLYRSVALQDQNGDAVDRTMTVGEAAEATRDSVVEITTEAVTTGSFMMQYVSEGAGSGVILTENGYIVTNHHVVDGATSISVRTTDGQTYPAELVGSDDRADLAVIKIDASGLQPAVLGDFTECKVGDSVVAIGNPLGQLGGTVTVGYISALDRQITIDGNIMTLLQTDAAINPGNSGGGLFNRNGELIGIVNAKSSGDDVEGLGFAIPINLAEPVISDLIEYGYVTGRVDTGIQVLEIADYQTAMYYRVNTLGLYVYSVEDGSNAAKAGFRSGDLIRSIDGTEIATEADYDSVLQSHAIGDTLSFTVTRSGQTLTFSLMLAEYKPVQT